MSLQGAKQSPSVGSGILPDQSKGQSCFSYNLAFTWPQILANCISQKSLCIIVNHMSKERCQGYSLKQMMTGLLPMKRRNKIIGMFLYNVLALEATSKWS